jgi:hypothetical protein
MKSAWHAYPGTYIDGRGTENVIIFNDGEALEVEIRGVRFAGPDFDSLSPADDASTPHHGQFVLNKDELCDCTITCDVPQVVGAFPPERYLGTLHVDLRLGKPAPNGGIDREVLTLTLSYGEWFFSSCGTGGLFEFELLDLKKQLPAGHHFLNCFGCAYSDYFYGGQGLFGSMYCFRDSKAEYLAVRTKDDYIAIFGKNAGSVQETHICPQFTRRGVRIGYRG